MGNELVNTTPVYEVIDITETKVLKKPTRSDVAEKTIELLAQAEKVSEHWLGKADDYKIIWINPEEFVAMVKKYKELVDLGSRAGSNRKIVRSELDVLNAEITSKIPIVKNYLLEIYGRRQRSAYYADLGIEKINKQYVFPKTIEARKTALVKMLDGIEKHGFGNYKHGTAYWTDIIERYNKLYLESYQKTGDVSASSGGKKGLKIRIQKILRAIRALVKINHPETWQQELRVWGFHRERL